MNARDPAAAAGGCQPHNSSRSGVPVCQPLHWRQPEVELPHHRCPAGLGLVHGHEPRATMALRTGAVTGAAADRLLSKC